MRVLAGDPDTKVSGLAVVDERRVLAVRTPGTDNFFRGHDAVREQLPHLVRSVNLLIVEYEPDVAVFEVPQDYEMRRKARPNDLICLGLVTGAMAATCTYHGVRVEFVYPRDWKGQQPKGINQARTLDFYGWKYRRNYRNPKKEPTVLGVPNDVDSGDGVPSNALSEVVDAMGMGLWRLNK